MKVELLRVFQRDTRPDRHCLEIRITRGWLWTTSEVLLVVDTYDGARSWKTLDTELTFADNVNAGISMVYTNWLIEEKRRKFVPPDMRLVWSAPDLEDEDEDEELGVYTVRTGPHR